MSKFRWIGQSPDGETVSLRRYRGDFAAPDFATPEWFAAHPDQWRTGACLDVETTGRNPQRDQVIEIGLRLFRFHRETGQILSREEGYSALQDPGEPLSEEIVRITGITDAMLAGQAIDWAKVQALLEASQIIIAHNASFDRPFLDRLLPLSATKIWGCSFRQVDWAIKGFPSQKLEILSIYHGFFVDAHRALADADAVLHLLGMADPVTGTPYFAEVLKNARRRTAIVWAAQSPIETKGLLRERGYRWDTERRVWHRLIFSEECAAEQAWLTEHVYGGSYRGIMRELALSDGFKAMADLAASVD